MRKLLAITLSFVLLIGLLGGCGQNAPESQSEQPASASEQPKADEPVTISILQAQIEYVDAYNAYIAEYKKVKPNVNIDIQVLQTDYTTVLRSKIASDSTPDIFMTTAGGEIQAYSEYSADLSNEPLANVMMESVKKDNSYEGKLLAAPLVMDTFPLIYNKQLFEQTGITEMPRTLTELEDVCKKLEASGITPFANGYKEWWVYKHMFQHFMAGDTDDTEKLAHDFIAGTTTFADHPTLMNFFDFIDLTVKYGLPKPLESDFNAQVSSFATGKAAIITGQGQWIESGVTKIDPDFDFGVMLYPVSDDPAQANVCAGAGMTLRVNKDSKVKDEAVALLNWLYTSDYGKNWFGNVAKVVSPVIDAPSPDIKIPKAFAELTKENPPAGQPINYSLDSFHQRFGEIIQSYIGKTMTREQAVDEIQKAWTKLGAAK